jgi:hypothetical protein
MSCTTGAGTSEIFLFICFQVQSVVDASSMLDQTHINWNWFLERQRDIMPPVSFIETYLPARPSREAKPAGLPAYLRYTFENNRGAWPGIDRDNCGEFEWSCWTPSLLKMDPYGAPTRWIDIASGGPKDTHWATVTNVSWVKLSQSKGVVAKDGSTDTRLYVSIDWDNVPNADAEGEQADVYNGTGSILFYDNHGLNLTVVVPIVKPAPVPESFTGFVEGDGYVVMEANSFSANVSDDSGEYAFQEIEWYGRTVSGLEMLPASFKNFSSALGTGPRLTYDFYATGSARYSAGFSGTVEVTVQIGPSFNYMNGKNIALGIQLDDLDPVLVTPVPPTVEQPHAGTVPADWEAIVSSEIRNVTLEFELPGGTSPGEHQITIHGVTGGVIVERIWVDFGGVRNRGYSYLGPPESKRVAA